MFTLTNSLVPLFKGWVYRIVFWLSIFCFFDATIYAQEREWLPADDAQKHPLFTLKTNLLYDALTALNVEVEVAIGQHWSVAVEDVFPWWKNGNKWAFQMWEVGAEGRYWFKRTSDTEVLIGHFAGVYGMGAKYDFQNRHKGCYQGEYWSLGLTYGYAMAIGTHWNLEFSISLGYLSTDYRHYCPAEGWTELVRDRRKEGVFEYVGPTKVKVSLIYPIRMGSRKKGGCHD